MRNRIGLVLAAPLMMLIFGTADAAPAKKEPNVQSRAEQNLSRDRAEQPEQGAKHSERRDRLERFNKGPRGHRADERGNKLDRANRSAGRNQAHMQGRRSMRERSHGLDRRVRAGARGMKPGIGLQPQGKQAKRDDWSRARPNDQQRSRQGWSSRSEHRLDERRLDKRQFDERSHRRNQSEGADGRSMMPRDSSLRDNARGHGNWQRHHHREKAERR